MSRTPATPATRALERAGVTFRAHPYEMEGEDAHGTFGEAVAAALGVDPRRLFKTLLADVDGELVVGIVPVAARLSTRALAREAGGKRARLADAAAAERVTGYVPGGISPFGQRRRLRVFVDAGLEGWDTVYVSAGRRGLQVEVAPADLVRVLQARVAPLT